MFEFNKLRMFIFKIETIIELHLHRHNVTGSNVNVFYLVRVSERRPWRVALSGWAYTPRIVRGDCKAGGKYLFNCGDNSFVH